MQSVKPGQRFVARQNRSSEWIVEGVVDAPFRFPHVRMRHAGDRTIEKLLALSVLMDHRLFRPVDLPNGSG